MCICLYVVCMSVCRHICVCVCVGVSVGGWVVMCLCVHAQVRVCAHMLCLCVCVCLCNYISISICNIIRNYLYSCRFMLFVALTVWLAMSHIISSSASDDYCEHINSTYRQIIASTNLHDMPFAELENKSKPTIEELQQHISSDDACLQLALGHLDNEAAKKAYTNMMSMAKLKDWNTCTDEEVCPQLKKVSCAALACFLKHTGQQKVAKESRSRPKKALIDVYRSVFALRKIVFGNRPIKSSEEDDESEYETAVKEFEECCSMVCSRLFFIMQMVTPVITDGGDRIVPLTSSSGAKPKLSRSRRIGSPIIASPKKPGFFRLGSQPLSSQSEYDFDTRSDSIDFPNVSFTSITIAPTIILQGHF